MLSKTEGRLTTSDLIDDIIDPPASSFNLSALRSKEGLKSLKSRSFSSYSNIPSLFNKSKNDNTDNSIISLTNEFHDRPPLSLNRSNSSYITMSNDDRRKEIDMIIKHLYDGKLLPTTNDDRATSDISETSGHALSKGPITTTTTPMSIIKNDEDNKSHVETIDVCI